MKESRKVRMCRWQLFRSWFLILTGIVLVGICGCDSYGDGAADMLAHRKLVEERTKSMQLSTKHTERGTDLVGKILVDTLSGLTLVDHYGSFPSRQRGDHVSYRYFRSDGSFIYVDNWLQSSGEAKEGDYWKVTGPRLCVMHQSYSQEPSCYLVAKTNEGKIQFYIDDPGGHYHGLLTTSTSEFIEGPPPSVHSVFVDHYKYK